MSEPIVVVGSGPVGSVLALLLAQKDIAVTVLEARKQGASHTDNRALALSYGSRRILEKLGIWRDLANHATAINTIHVSQKGSFGRTLLQASDYKQEALGYVLSYGALSATLGNALSKYPNIHFKFEATAESISHNSQHATVNYIHQAQSHSLNSLLVVLADGGRSLDELVGLQRDTKEYGHEALISKVRAELPHDNVAYERFTSNGPIALLPNGERDFSLVWTGKKELILPFLELSDAEFLEKFHTQFGDRVGKFITVEKRLCFPLKMSQLQSTDLEHLVVIGNAAQTMHPVAGQGFNVGLRDAESLAQQILATPSQELGGSEMIDKYHASRKKDTKGGLVFTDFLVNIFSNDLLGVSALRASGLGLLDILKPVKKRLVSKMSFGK